MQGRQLGALSIRRVLEQTTAFAARTFFPQTTEADWAPHRSWLMPKAMDPKTGDLLLPMQSYVVRTSHHNVLIDACIGNHKERANRPSWHLKTDDTYMTGLAAVGLTPEDIDFVMCTHMHGDHVGWNTRLDNGRWVPTFPNARYLFSELELRTWERELANRPNQPLVDSVLPVVAAGRADLVKNDHAVDDELWLESTPGHTPDHVAIRLASGNHSAVMSGDLMHCPVQCLYPEWVAMPDWDPAVAAHTRRAFLERYCESDTLVCTAHFPLPSIGHVVRDGDAFGFRYEDASW